MKMKMATNGYKWLQIRLLWYKAVYFVKVLGLDKIEEFSVLVMKKRVIKPLFCLLLTRF